MNRWILGMAVMGLFAGAQSVNAQIYTYGVAPGAVYAPGVAYATQPYAPQAYVAAAPVVTSAYYAPVYVQAPIVQMRYSEPMLVQSPIVAAPVVIGPGLVRERVHVSPHNYTRTVRTYGPTPGPHYSRVHVHTGLFGTTVRERSW